MKRGNTALKRGVGLASALALAIAGAVIAAPAANAWSGTAANGLVRATPVADAAYVGDYDFTAAYSTDGTGQVPAVAIGKTFQPASGLQIFLPIDSAGSNNPYWGAGNVVTVTLPSADYKFSSAPTVSLAAQSVDTTNVDSLAAYNGTNAHALPAGGGKLASSVVTVSGAGTQQLTIALPDPTLATPGAGAGDDAYLLTISNISIDIAASHAAAPGETVVATVAGAAGSGAGTWVGGSAGIAYVNSLAISTVGTPTTSGTTVTLPAVIVSELVKDAFLATASADIFEIQVTGTGNTAGGIALDTSGPTLAAINADEVAAPSTVKTPTVAAGASANSVKVTVGTAPSTSTSAVESVAISGLKVSNVKPGTDLTVTIVKPFGPAASTTPAQVDAGSVVVKTSEAAAPRFAGANRYATAAKIAAARTWGGTAVVVANGTDAKNGADALSANFLAGVLNAPLLLTSADSLAAESEQALKDLFKGSSASVTVYYMGKTDSVSQAVRDKIEATIKGAQSVVGTVTAKKVEGDDRYATAAEAAMTVDINDIKSYNLGEGTLRTAFLASGQVNADALAAGALSAGSQIPVLLTTDADTLPKATSDAISALHLTQIVILGGTDRVSQKVEDDLKAAGVNVIRLAGADRFDTSTKIAALGLGVSPDGVRTAAPGADSVALYLANGIGGWADALAAGPYVGKTGGSLITIGAGNFTTATSLFLANNKAALGEAQGLGGTDRVTDAQIAAASALAK